VAEETTYLELSEEGGGAHKFYEVVIDDTKVSIRYGRIGDKGQTQVTTLATAAEAQTFAQKKIKEKTRSGYAPAVMGARQKRAVTRRQVTSYHSTAKQAPVLWRFDSNSSTFGIFINERHCWIGNQAGHIFALDHTGQTHAQFSLPDGVKCLVADDIWIYAGCDNGKVYDLTGKIPRAAYEISDDVDIYWLDIRHGDLAVSDAGGAVGLMNHEGESVWLNKTNNSSGWMVRIDDTGVYHGHSSGVTMYNKQDGQRVWQRQTGAVLFGWQEETMVYAGTGNSKVHSFTKQGLPSMVYDCDGAVYSCATAPDGKYVFAGDYYSSVYCFDQAGTRLWKLGTGCGSALSMQFFDDRLYIVTTQGMLACIDVSESGIQAAQGGVIPQAALMKAAAVSAAPPSTTLETTSDASQGVILECYRDGSTLRVRVVSPGYNSALHVQFPKDLRQAGTRYLVDNVHLATHGNFYRTHGDIKKLV
jgi:outer membrane protein assembly factor BamB